MRAKHAATFDQVIVHETSFYSVFIIVAIKLMVIIFSWIFVSCFVIIALLYFFTRVQVNVKS